MKNFIFLIFLKSVIEIYIREVCKGLTVFHFDDIVIKDYYIKLSILK